MASKLLSFDSVVYYFDECLGPYLILRSSETRLHASGNFRKSGLYAPVSIRLHERDVCFGATSALAQRLLWRDVRFATSALAWRLLWRNVCFGVTSAWAWRLLRRDVCMSVTWFGVTFCMSVIIFSTFLTPRITLLTHVLPGCVIYLGAYCWGWANSVNRSTIHGTVLSSC